MYHTPDERIALRVIDGEIVEALGYAKSGERHVGVALAPTRS
jgi:hypothetical protein